MNIRGYCSPSPEGLKLGAAETWALLFDPVEEGADEQPALTVEDRAAGVGLEDECSRIGRRCRIGGIGRRGSHCAASSCGSITASGAEREREVHR